jgi:hypothetical protein
MTRLHAFVCTVLLALLLSVVFVGCTVAILARTQPAPTQHHQQTIPAHKRAALWFA